MIHKLLWNTLLFFFASFIKKVQTNLTLIKITCSGIFQLNGYDVILWDFVWELVWRFWTFFRSGFMKLWLNLFRVGFVLHEPVISNFSFDRKFLSRNNLVNSNFGELFVKLTFMSSKFYQKLWKHEPYNRHEAAQNRKFGVELSTKNIIEWHTLIHAKTF